MSFSLSLLDKSPIPNGKSGADAFQSTLSLARRAEELGFKRYWVAEHHDMPNLASSAPEALIAFLAAKTNRIRIGSGGIMLQHYSAYKVAETFNVLSSLAPGRIDLGVGKAPGGFPSSTRALQARFDAGRKPSFAEQLEDLRTYLDGDDDRDRPHALPRPPFAPERFLLGASPDSAILAAEKGWTFVFAGHLNGDPDNLRRSFDAYQHATGGGIPILALNAFAAGSEEQARERIGDLRIVKVFLPGGQTVSVGSEEQAAEFARQAGVSDYRTEEKIPSVLHGTPATIHHELEKLHRLYGVEEFILETPALSPEERLTSIELIGTTAAEAGLLIKAA
ncbi:LLM class flavin-dependent oxidoreductase [Rhizobium grahamii]|uniref:Alkane 1-monooxygenase n=1 Tax=Rhizobium grahamii TaxID=1120045 RepID=A0A370KPF8_9HYPH|nr:LLM class flavin-dependent oxidoreductase [Rhizobium grahamii]RDJ11230.1 alkane 1-monooxygenase [Rhizobium grahamii]